MPTQQVPTMVSIVPFLIIMAVFYFLLIRPQQTQAKKHRELIERLKKNDEIVSAGGIHATIINVKEKTFVVRVDENVKIEIDKSAVASVKKIAQ